MEGAVMQVAVNNLIRFLCSCEAIAYAQKMDINSPRFHKNPVPAHLRDCPGQTLGDVARLGDKSTLQLQSLLMRMHQGSLEHTAFGSDDGNAEFVKNRVQRLMTIRRVRATLAKEPELFGTYERLLDTPSYDLLAKARKLLPKQ